ncbi:TonB-dependent receptor plug domain-containing protein [Sphingomonas abietis]|uniref:TonB-dependent receptor n=1 Tax=Sphingomonas abietis TaxID=3012344 RepID=A0ABY7NQ53_9SPHN|nr:TonB-dependent receptor [Sphingomonas abietis]WBO21621.1 TonB-dependent receptor [Sphingomonas abietis]
MRLMPHAGLVSAAALACALSAHASFAQSGTPPVADPTATASSATTPADEIIVTGSRIRHSPLDQPSPVTFIDKADIDRTGLSSIADVLQRMPSAGGGLNSKNNSSGNLGNPQDGGGVGAGTSEIDLRYLQSKRTLVMVDSLRFVNASSASGVPGSVDLNSIPQAAIERVEVLQDGASAIYGSDAISGVVNIITKTKQKGLEVSLQHGLFREGDGFTRNYDASYGFSIPSAGTEVVFGGSYVQQKPVFRADRAFALFSHPFISSCDSSCSSATPLGRFIVGDNDLTLKSAVGGRPAFDPLDPTGAGSDFKDFSNADRYNTAPLNYLLTPYKRYSAFASLTQPLGGDIKFSSKFFFNRRESANQAAPLPLFIGPDSGNGNLLDTITIDGSNPYNPFGTLSAGTAGTPANYSFVARRLVENGPRHYSQTVDSYYGTATLSGQFQLLGHDWFWDLNGVYGTSHARQTFTGNVNAAHVQEALGPIADCTGDCVPLNLFGGAGSITPAMLNYIAFTEHDRSMQRIWDGTANLSGSLFDLPAGPVGVAFGYEHRDLKGSFTPDPIIQAGLGADIPAQATAGQYNSDEVYGELSVPILKDKPFFQMLNGSFAARYSNYSTGSSKVTLKGGGDWKPVQDVVLRGTYAQGFRAPSIGELFGSLSRFDAPVDDPCNGLNAPGFNSTVRQNCIANGAPSSGDFQQQGSQLPVLTGGNDRLKPETSRSWVGGGVYSASWARDWARTLTLEVNYYNIRVKDAIGAIDPATLLDRCAQTADALSCSAIHRSASGQITQIVGTLQNISSIKTDGLDVNFTYRSPTGPYGAVGLTWLNTFTFKYDEVSPTADGSSTVKRAGTESGTQGYPKYKSNATFDWSLGQFTASITGRYIAAIHEATGDFAGHEMGRRLYGDIQLLWDTKLGDRAFNFAVGVNNIAGTAPPACYSCSLANYDPAVYDLPSQFFYARVGVKL